MHKLLCLKKKLFKVYYCPSILFFTSMSLRGWFYWIWICAVVPFNMREKILKSKNLKSKKLLLIRRLRIEVNFLIFNLIIQKSQL